ncbi:unnamed protein product [Candida verbasci]|uniref:Alternative oxidase n=1 Tax=Candida verbasci TaxID=1227364 RepID=A0A9W4XJU5_9ASCO|nr:unnamed protein product [Candida verbasci]
MLSKTVLLKRSFQFRFISTSIATQPIETKPILDISTNVHTNDEIESKDDKKFITHSMYPHPGYSKESCQNIFFSHREPRTLGDKIAFSLTYGTRRLFDFITGYKDLSSDDVFQHANTRWYMTESKWLSRIIVLESVASCPGAVASFLRHLHSVRLLKRDKAFIETLQEEAYNERMHLLTFIKIGTPSWFTRLAIYIGQGIFTNLFFISYLISPKNCHRFVGYLEEEAVRTYSHLLHELNVPGRLSKFENLKIPTIAYQYWNELNPNSSFKDLIMVVRADEAKHREVNHTFANLQKNDRNPFSGLHIENFDKPQPSLKLDNTRPTGWERKDLYL